MAQVTVYATPFCLYCVGAKALLRRRGIAYDEVRINMFSDGARDRLQAESGGGRTFPQIVIDGDPVSDIRQSDRITHVMLNGRLYEVPTMNETLTGTSKLRKWYWEK